MKHPETARRLREALNNKGMKAQDLSALTGIYKSSISQYVNGSHKPSNITAAKMGEVLNVNPLWLMGFDVSSMSDVDKFTQTAEIINRSLQETEHAKDFHRLSTENKQKIFLLTKKLLEAQSAEENILIAAHRREGDEE